MSRRGSVIRLRQQFGSALGTREPGMRRFLGLVGDGSGNDPRVDADEPNYVWVRVAGRGTIPVLNTKVPNRNDIPVVVGYIHERPDTLQIIDVWESEVSDLGRYSYVPFHHQAHELFDPYGGDDTVWVQGLQFLPFQPHPTSPASWQIVVEYGLYPWDTGVNIWYRDETHSFSGDVPATASTACLVTVSIDGATNLLQYDVGPDFSMLMPPADWSTIIAAAPAGSVPICAVHLYNGQDGVTWGHIWDMRQHNSPVGGSVSPGAHPLLTTATHDDTAVATPPTRGSMVVANATPLWDELVHPAAAGHALVTTVTDTVWDQTPNWTGLHTFDAGLTIGAGQGITMADDTWIGLAAGNSLVFDSTPAPDQVKLTGIDLHAQGNKIIVDDTDDDTYFISPADDTVYLYIGGLLDFSFVADTFQVRAGSGVEMGDGTWLGLGPALGRLVFDLVPPTVTFTGPLDLNMVGNSLIIDNTDLDSYVLSDADDVMKWFFAGAQEMEWNGVLYPGHLHVGLNAAAQSVVQFLAQDTALNTAAGFVGIQSEYTKTGGASDAADNYFGLLSAMSMNQAGGTVGTMAGYNVYSTITAATLVTTSTGGYLSVIMNGGTVGTAYGAYFTYDQSGGTVTGNQYGLFAQLDLDAGTVAGICVGTYINIDQEAAHTSGNIYGEVVYIDADGTNGTVYMHYIASIDGVDYGYYQTGTLGTGNYFAGNVAIGGTLNVTLKATFAGGHDPPYVMYDTETRLSIVKRIKWEVPTPKLGGLVLFYNEPEHRLEYLIPNQGIFYDLQGRQVGMTTPITETYKSRTMYYFDNETGEVRTMGIPPRHRDSGYELRTGYSLDPDTGRFFWEEQRRTVDSAGMAHVHMQRHEATKEEAIVEMDGREL